MRRWGIIALVVLLVLGAGAAAGWYYLDSKVRITDYERPQQIDAAPEITDGETVLVTSVGVPIETIRSALERDVPRKLWAIDQQKDNCVPRKDIKVLGRKLAKTPKVKCRITGQVNRGRIAVTGTGDRLVARIPVNATVRARDIGGVIEQETANASAVMEVTVRVSVGRDWSSQSDLDLGYRWTREPGIDLLGQRITFTKPADRELKGVLRKVERSLQRQVSTIKVRPRVAALWDKGFATISLSKDKPPVWLTIAPQSAGVGRFRVRGRELVADVMVVAKTRVKVGERPADPVRTALGPNAPIRSAGGFSAVVPVMADYAQLEPVVLRALQGLAKKGVSRQDLGRIDLDFQQVQIFATEGGRLAVGVTLEAEPIEQRTGQSIGRSKGQVWLVGRPVTEAGSELVHIEDLRIFGDTDRLSGDVLVRVMQMDEISTAIEAALVEDFQSDYAGVVDKVRAGLANVRSGDLQLAFTLSEIEHGAIQVTGQGLYMPVTAKGSVRADVRIR